MLTRMEQIGASMIADSPEVRLRVREQLMQGTSQVKLTAGGGVSSPHSPLDVSTFTEAELRAAVEATENWGTYVAALAFTPQAIQRAIAAGVRCIEHGFGVVVATWGRVNFSQVLQTAAGRTRTSLLGLTCRRTPRTRLAPDGTAIRAFPASPDWPTPVTLPAPQPQVWCIAKCAIKCCFVL
jgi:hypothetical protein